MRTIVKRIVIHLYCRGLISNAIVRRVFERFNLRSA